MLFRSFGDLFQKYVKSLIKIKGYELIYEDFLDVYDTKSETKKGKKDLDVCFTIGNTIYYFESKLNLNLDTEKTEATDNKIKDINEYLVKKNVNYNVVSALLTCWWGDEKDLPIRTKTKVYFMKDFLELINQVCDKNEYYEKIGRAHV